MKKTLMTKVAKTIERLAHAGAGKMCVGDWHQPKVPEALRTKK